MNRFLLRLFSIALSAILAVGVHAGELDYLVSKGNQAQSHSVSAPAPIIIENLVKQDRKPAAPRAATGPVLDVNALASTSAQQAAPQAAIPLKVAAIPPAAPKVAVAPSPAPEATPKTFPAVLDSDCKPSLVPDEIKALILKISTEEKLEPRLAEAVAKVESELGQRMVSPAGAVGIMQLMPATAKDYGVTNRCDPEQNVRAGVRYLRDLIERFGDPLLALAAYNAGPRTVTQKGGIPINSQTEGYIIRVLNHWRDYKTTIAQGNSQRPVAILAAPTPTPEDSPPQTGWKEGHVLEL